MHLGSSIQINWVWQLEGPLVRWLQIHNYQYHAATKKHPSLVYLFYERETVPCEENFWVLQVSCWITKKSFFIIKCCSRAKSIIYTLPLGILTGCPIYFNCPTRESNSKASISRIYTGVVWLELTDRFPWGHRQFMQESFPLKSS